MHLLGHSFKLKEILLTDFIILVMNFILTNNFLMNPDFHAGMGLFVIIPIHTKQVIYTLGKRLLSVFKAR